jgi:hypothetical protein
LSGESGPAKIARRLRFQSRACAHLGSPLYADLLDRAAADAEAGGTVWELLRGHERDPGPSALALRLMGSVHRLTLDGSAPDLAELYADPHRDADATWRAFAKTIASHANRLTQLVDHGVQTNETGRCAALLPGFLTVAAATGLPLRLLEAGASAGLNLRFDRYRYELGPQRWGPEASAVTLAPVTSGEPPRAAEIEIAERAGCDAAPVDSSTEDGRLTLLSYVWPDQPERLARLRAALEIAGEVEASVERCSAAEWTSGRLAEPAEGVATVVFHSIFIQYPSESEREAFIGAIARAGAQAGAAAPLAWLRMEPAGKMTEVQLTMWPGGEELLLARAGYHGDPLQLTA